MKKVLIISVFLIFAACSNGYFGITGVILSDNLEYYKGAIPNSFYTQNYMGERALKVTGKPWMIVKYERSTHHILDFAFGLSEITQSNVGEDPIPYPTASADMIMHSKKLNLKGPIALLVCWPVTTNVLDQEIYNGSLGAGGVIFYYNHYGYTFYTFSYLPAGSMVGGAKNLDGTGIETLTGIDFNLLRQ